MVIIRLKGGLGNQLFQLSLAHFLNKKYNFEVKLDNSFYAEQNIFLFRRKLNKSTYNFNYFSPYEFATKIELIRLLKFNYNIRIYNYFDKILLNTPFNILKLLFKNNVYDDNLFSKKLDFFDNSIYDGYWQQSRIYENFQVCMKNYLNKILFKNLLFKSSTIKNFLSKYIVIHVRKGDYKYFKMYDNLTHIYYLNALRRLEQEVNIDNIIICTDDKEWCYNFLFPYFQKYTFSFSDDIFINISDFEILKNANYLIIANSTFSFWGAFLGSNQIVIYPNKWVNGKKFDFLLENWVECEI